MAVEFNPNDYHPAAPSAVPQAPGVHPQMQPQIQPQPHPQIAPQPAAQPYAPQPVPQAAPPQVQPPMPQAMPAGGQPVPYDPAQARPQQPPSYQYTAPQRAPQHAPQYSPQAPTHAPQPHPQAHGAQAAHIAEEEAPKSRFKRKKKAPKVKQPREKAAAGQSGFLKPYLLGLVSGAVLTFAGLALMGNLAQKNAQARSAAVAAAVQQQNLNAETTIIGEEVVVAETPGEIPE